MADADDWAPVAQQPKDDWAPVAPVASEPATIPDAFLNRVAQGEAMKKAYEDMVAKPVSQRIKEWSAAALKEGGAIGYGEAAIGSVAATIASFPETIASGVKAAGDALTGKILTGPGLRKEDLSDDPNAPEPLDTLIQRSQDMAMSGGVRETFGDRPLLHTDDGRVARPYTAPDGTVRAQVVGSPPTPQDYGRAAEAIKGAAQVVGSPSTEVRLKQLWQDDGIHPSEAAHDAANDAFLKHDLTAKAEDVKPDQAMLDNWPEAVPQSLGAAVNDLPSRDIPLDKQPASPPGGLSASIKNASDKLYDIGRDAQMLVSPMATGTRDSMAMAKDFANSMRRNRWEWSRIDDDVAKRFSPEQRESMWIAADEESVMRQSGETDATKGLATLSPEERAAVNDLQARAQNAWLRARDLGMVEGEGLPAYTPRMVINAAGAAGKDGPIPLNGIGQNLRTRTGNLLKRQYLTAEETEAAAKAKYGDQASLAKDIRVLPLATSQLEDAIAGRSLIENIKEYGKRTGTETVAEGAIPEGGDTKWFTLDHPAFRTWRPKFEYKPNGDVALEGNMTKVVKDADGNTIFEQVPLYVHGDFEGPLKSILAQRNGQLYSAAIAMKAKTMSLIMNSPLIHNLVEWGRALPAMPGKVLTGRVYFQGNRFKNDVAGMREAIDSGMVPIGGRFFKQSVDDIVANPSLTPGDSFTAKIASFVPGLFDEAAGTAVKRAIDKAGNFWHNTLLWDRIGDLQAGLYVNFRDEMVAKGIDRQTSTRMAAHLANRFAGALPEEAMSAGARKTANILLFSRSFTMGNLGVMKDMLTGMPKDVLAQIERDTGTVDPNALGYAKSMARRRASATVLIDMGFAYAGYSVLQSAVNVLRGDTTLSQEYHDYADRFAKAMSNMRENPIQALQPFNFAHNLSAAGQNEAGRQDRLFVGYAKDGTGIYARMPPGKMGEEFEGWLTGSLDMIRRKLSPMARFGWDVLANDKGFGRKVYDPNADTIPKYIDNLGKIAFHLMEAHAPAGQISAAADLIKGEGDSKVNALQAFGPLAGVTFSKGAPGGPAVGEMYHAREQHDYAVQAQLPDIRRQIQRGDMTGARQRMNDLGIPTGLQNFYVRTSVNPATRLSSRTLRDFYNYASPEQKARLERFRAGPLAPTDQ